jgi:hypothetical protein
MVPSMTEVSLIQDSYSFGLGTMGRTKSCKYITLLTMVRLLGLRLTSPPSQSNLPHAKSIIRRDMS